MSDIEHLTYPLPKKLMGALSKLASIAIQSDTLEFRCEVVLTNGYSLRIDKLEITDDLSGFISDPLESLEQAGFVRKREGWVFLLPPAFDRARYEGRSKIGQWWERLRRSGSITTTLSLIFSFLAFLISVIVGSSSALIELLKIFGYLPTP